jgi:hypothetical protein
MFKQLCSISVKFQVQYLYATGMLLLIAKQRVGKQASTTGSFM